MNCLRVRKEIKAYIDGELGSLTRRRVARHIARCEDCRREMQEMTELTNEVANVPNVSAPEGLKDKVLGNLTFQPNSVPSTWRPRIGAGSKVVGAMLIALVLIVACSSYLTMGKTVMSRIDSAATSIGDSGGDGGDGWWGTYEPPVEKSRKAKSAAKFAPSQKAAGRIQSAAEPSASAPLMIIKTANLGVRVRSFQQASDAAVSIAKSSAGYVTDTSASSDHGVPTEGEMTLRVPVDAFERTLNRLAKLGTVTSRSINGQDVTGESVDLESRLRNLRAEERQYLEIMNRAKRIPDIVTVTNELTRVRGEIEEAQGRLGYLKNSSAMSTINLSLSEKKRAQPHRSSIETTFGNAIASLLGTLNGLASMAIWLAVYSPFWAIPIAIWLHTRKRAAAVTQ